MVMKKVLSLTLVFMLVFSMTTLVPAFASEADVTTVSLAGTTDNADNPVNIILTDKNAATANAASIRYINQVKPDKDGKWSLNFKIKGRLNDYKILFRQNGTTSNEIAPENIVSITPEISLKLSASIAAKTITATLNVDNGNYHELSCKVIIATYDSMGNLVDTYAPDVNVSKNEAEMIKVIEHELPENASYAKVFCWSDTTPLTKSVLAQDVKGYIQNRGSLGNVFTKLNNGEDVTVVYLGGSVTWGAGASNRDSTSWRALTTKWLREQYPDANITSINAAVGATGSFWGSMRVKNDVLSYNPDLVFVMYPINDVYESMSEDNTKRQMEEIIRQIREYDDEIDIIMGYDTDNAKGATREPYDMVRWQEEVAIEYNVSSMDMGRRLANAVHNGETTWETALSDAVHPSDLGYKYYAEVANTLLEEGMENAPQTLVSYTVPDERKFGKAIDAVMYKPSDNFAPEKTPQDYNSVLYNKVYVLAPGESISFTIEGNRFGVHGTGYFSFTSDGKASTPLALLSGNVYRNTWYDLGKGEHEIVLANNSTENSTTVYAVFAWNE